jgi:hypothetical protein
LQFIAAHKQGQMHQPETLTGKLFGKDKFIYHQLPALLQRPIAPGIGKLNFLDNLAAILVVSLPGASQLEMAAVGRNKNHTQRYRVW